MSDMRAAASGQTSFQPVFVRRAQVVLQASLSFRGRGCLRSNGASGTAGGKLQTVLIGPNSLPVYQP